jgi:hypothetical protein
LKHVFVETNFLIEVARPNAGSAAQKLLARARDQELTLHVPWVAVAESKRTLDRKINEDLGFSDAMLKFVVREFLAGAITKEEKKVVDEIKRRASEARAAALKGIASAIDAVVADMSVIEPDKDVVAKTLAVFTVKSLKPFDEMVLRAVLTKATELHSSGETELTFCNLDKSDFDPTNQPKLAVEYKACGLTFVTSFDLN